MLTIRRQQMRVLTFPVSQAILVAHARETHAEAIARLGEAGLLDVAAKVIRLCGDYGLETTADHLRMMDLAMIFGADWRTPECMWLDEGMRDSQIAEPNLRLRKVWRSALRRLARET